MEEGKILEIEKNTEKMKKKEKIKTLELRISELEDINNKYLLNIADLQNDLKRIQKNIETSKQEEVRKLFSHFLPLFDSLKMAVENDEKELKKGLDTILNQVNTILDTLEVEEINPKLGEKFDYNSQEAIMTKEHPDYKSGEINEVFQTGYSHKNILIRPARVSTTS